MGLRIAKMRVEFGPLSIRLPRTKPAPSGQGFQHERLYCYLTDENQELELWAVDMEVREDGSFSVV